MNNFYDIDRLYCNCGGRNKDGIEVRAEVVVVAGGMVAEDVGG